MQPLLAFRGTLGVACRAQLQAGHTQTVSSSCNDDAGASNDRVTDFYSLARTAGWINVAGFVCCVILLLSFAFLPVEKSRRHYLSVSLVVAIILLQVSHPLG